MQLFIGTYTERLPHVNGKAEGILTASFDPATGAIGPPRAAAAALNPSYLALSADGKYLYAVSETGSFGGRPGGGVAAYARDPAAGGLTLLNAVPSGGPNPCYVSLDRTGRFVLVANYGNEAGSVTAYEVTPDGRLGNMTAHVRHAGSGPDTSRQAGAHAHMIVSDPVTGAVLAADLGSDAVLSYRLDDTGGLTPDVSARLAAAPGAGPRHLAFHPGGEHLLVISELDCTVSVRRRDGRRWAGPRYVSTLPAAAGDGPNLAAAIRVSPSGRHVLVSNRGHDSIAVYRFEPDRSALRLLGHAAAPGAVPRELVVTPDGRHVIVACQDSDLLASYPFDDSTGELGEPACVSAPTPVCLVFGPGPEPSETAAAPRA